MNLVLYHTWNWEIKWKFEFLSVGLRDRTYSCYSRMEKKKVIRVEHMYNVYICGSMEFLTCNIN